MCTVVPGAVSEPGQTVTVSWLSERDDAGAVTMTPDFDHVGAQHRGGNPGLGSAGRNPDGTERLARVITHSNDQVAKARCVHLTDLDLYKALVPR